MEILFVYAALLAFIVAIAGLFVPARLVFWCAEEDRSRVMAFTAYFALAVVLCVVFVVVVPEPEPKPIAPPVEVVEEKPALPELTEPIFLKDVQRRLTRDKEFTMDGLEFSLLDFGKTGATAALKFADKPHRKIAVDHATRVVEAMVATFKAYKWKTGDPFLVECQVHTNLKSPIDGSPTHRSMGFARYRPDSGKITWLDFN